MRPEFPRPGLGRQIEVCTSSLPTYEQAMTALEWAVGQRRFREGGANSILYKFRCLYECLVCADAGLPLRERTRYLDARDVRALAIIGSFRLVETKRGNPIKPCFSVISACIPDISPLLRLKPMSVAAFLEVQELWEDAETELRLLAVSGNEGIIDSPRHWRIGMFTQQEFEDIKEASFSNHC